MKEIKATMAGTVLNVLTETGKSILAGEMVLMLESMKMEIPVEAEAGGTVAEVKVSIGDFVNEDDVLILLED